MAGKKNRSGVLAGCVAAVAVAMVSGGSAKAATLFSTGFEVSNVSPANFTSVGYTQGALLTGQPNTGTKFTSAVTTDVTSGSGAATVATYNGTGFTGTASNAQYVQINDLSGIAPTTAAYYFPNLGSISPLTTGMPVVDVVGTIGVSGGTNNAVFGLVAFDGTGAQNEVADLAVDAGTGRVTVQNGATLTSFSQTATPVTFESYELQLNYVTQTYNVFAAPAGATSFTSAIATNIPFETAATTFSTGGFDTFSRAATLTATGLGLVDNLAITTNPVPEPASASLLVGGLLLAGGRRRRAAR